MGSMVSGLADAVLGVVEGVGLSADTVARYRKCCGVVVKFCDQRDLDALSARVVDDFVACQQERARCGEIGPNRRNALVKSARMMLEFQTAGAVVWRMMSPDPDLTLSESSRVVLKQFAAAAGLELAPGSVRLLASEIRQFLAYLDRTSGVYDVAANAGWVNVGTDHDTAAFAVESIGRWWTAMGRPAYPHAWRLLITADASGSNSYRTRAWKAKLAAFALKTGLLSGPHRPVGTRRPRRRPGRVR